jgi:hypothetical protein
MHRVRDACAVQRNVPDIPGAGQQALTEQAVRIRRQHIGA